MNSSMSQSNKSSWIKTAAGYAAGLLFGIGLAVSGMTDPARVVGFLDVAGAWDPTLMFVLGGAVVTTFIGYRLSAGIQAYCSTAGWRLSVTDQTRVRCEVVRGRGPVWHWLGTFRLLPRASDCLHRRSFLTAIGHAGDHGVGVVCR